MFRRVFVLIFLVGAAVQFACADSPKITAVLTSSEVVVGETVRLEIQIDNARASAITPREIEVPGLQIHYTGESTQMTMRNFSVSSSITYSYTILPEKSGTYKIPPQTIRVGKDNLQTPELTLRVADFGQGDGRQEGQPGTLWKCAGWQPAECRRKDRIRGAIGAEKDRLRGRNHSCGASHWIQLANAAQGNGGAAD